MHNPFRTKDMRRRFDAVVTAYDALHPALLGPEGRQRHGNVVADYFWRGYNSYMLPGQGLNRWDKQSKQCAAYASWRAGFAVREREEKALKP